MPTHAMPFCGGGAFVGIDFAAFGEGPFPESGFPQRLSLYDGQLEVRGSGVDCRVLAWPDQDVIAIAVDDRGHSSASRPRAAREWYKSYKVSKSFGSTPAQACVPCLPFDPMLRWWNANL